MIDRLSPINHLVTSKGAALPEAAPVLPVAD
jgi:hypothetical protein